MLAKLATNRVLEPSSTLVSLLFEPRSSTRSMVIGHCSFTVLELKQTSSYRLRDLECHKCSHPRRLRSAYLGHMHAMKRTRHLDLEVMIPVIPASLKAWLLDPDHHITAINQAGNTLKPTRSAHSSVHTIKKSLCRNHNMPRASQKPPNPKKPPRSRTRCLFRQQP